MAEEEKDESQKTEEPTDRRLQKAQEDGQSPHSKELSHLVMLLGMGLIILFYFPFFVPKVQMCLLPFLANPHALNWKALIDILTPLAIYVMMPLMFLFMIGVAVGFYQNKMVFSGKSLVPDLSKISLKKGFGRIFSTKNLFEFAKSLVYVAVIFSIVSYVVYHIIRKSEMLVWFDLVQLLTISSDHIAETLLYVIIVVAVFTVLDVLFQHFDFRKKMRMTKQEVKDEHKESEGDPIIKGRIRRMQMERARRRMMAAVMTADVVITNPTHYAVALKYDENTMMAPVVVAKGVDFVAQKIREIATEHRIYITRNPPLARALYKLDLDTEVPAEHYKAVAEVIIYVMKLRQKF